MINHDKDKNVIRGVGILWFIWYSDFTVHQYWWTYLRITRDGFLSGNGHAFHLKAMIFPLISTSSQVYLSVRFNNLSGVSLDKMLIQMYFLCLLFYLLATKSYYLKWWLFESMVARVVRQNNSHIGFSRTISAFRENVNYAGRTKILASACFPCNVFDQSKSQ